MTQKHRTEHLRGTRELTADELERVSGGGGRKAGNNSQEYLEIKFTEVLITSV